MNEFKLLMVGAIVLGASIGTSRNARSQEVSAKQVPAAQDDSRSAAIRANSAKIESAFNAGKVEDLASMFLPNGELIDEQGTIYQSEQEIKAILSALFAKFPGIQVRLNTESIRAIGPTAIEEGTRTMSEKDGASKAQLRYLTIWVKTDGGWKIASHRDVVDDPAPTPNEYLQSIAWLEGDWVNEGADGTVAISFRWSEDKNFLLGEFIMDAASDTARKSSQRIGWDARAGSIRSWLFDSDGGFSEGTWAILDDGAMIKSTSVNPDGTSASATLTITQVDEDHFTFAGTERIVGGIREPDFELTIARRPPTVGK